MRGERVRTARLAAKLRAGLPRSLDGAPFLLPTTDTALRRELDGSFEDRKIAPSIVAEVQLFGRPVARPSPTS